jgi:uncharacterized integral membrane protein (TIGR00698 family)
MQQYHSMLVKIMDTARKVLNADKATLFLYDAKTKELWSAVIQNDEVREIRIPSNEGLAGTAFQTGEIINVADASKDPRFRKDIEDKSGYQCKTMLCMPVVDIKGKTIGSIQAINKLSGEPFTKEDEKRLQAFAMEAADTIANAGKLKKMVPGLAVVIAVATSAALLHWLLPGTVNKSISPVLLAIVLGLLIRNTFTLPVHWEPGIRFALHNMLRIAIVLLGARIAFTDVLNIGSKAMLMISILIVVAFAVAHVLARLMKIPVRLATLIAMGASICGNSAIAALSPVIKANEEELSFAVAVTTVLGTTAVILFPFIGTYFGFSDAVYGTWVGTSVHDTAQVVATGFAISPGAGEVATIVKLTRNAFLGIVIILVGLSYARWVGGQIGGKKVTLITRLKQSMPLFLLGFLLLAFLNTLGVFAWASDVAGYDVQSGLTHASALLMLGALAGVGLGTNLRRVRKIGMKPVYLGVAVSASIAILSLVLIRSLGPAA